jgi:small neutral amino acid transporter SnatA (MarC family)
MKKEKTRYEQESISNKNAAIGFIIIIILALLGDAIFNNL